MSSFAPFTPADDPSPEVAAAQALWAKAGQQPRPALAEAAAWLQDAERQPSPRARAWLQAAVAFSRFRLGEYAEAQAAAQAAREAATGIGDIHALGIAWRMEGNARSGRADMPGALPCFTQALQLARMRRDSGEEAMAQTGLAVVYQGLGDLLRAQEGYAQAVEAARVTGQARLLGLTLGNYAQSFIQTEDWARAEPLLREVLAVATQADDQRTLAYGKFNLGRVLLDLGRPAEALTILQEATALCVALGERVLECPCHLQLGRSLCATGATDAGVAELEQALALAEAQKSPNFTLSARTELARAWLAKGDHTRAETILHQGMEDPAAHPSRDQMGRWYALRADLAQAQGHWAEACRRLEALHEHERRTFREDADRRYRNLQLIHDLRVAHDQAEDARRREREQAALREEVERQRNELAQLYGALESNFARFVSPHVVKQLAERGATPQLGGTETEVTAFFSDLDGFSTVAEELSPTQLVRLMNSYFGAMTGILKEAGGTLDKFIGDAIVGIFNAPLPVPGHPLAACHVALQMKAALHELRTHWAAPGQEWPPSVTELRARIGLHTGPAVVGLIGAEGPHGHMNYTMMGDTVNLASRCETATRHYGVGIMVTGDTRTLAEAQPAHAERPLVFRFLDRAVVKGRSRPVDFHELYGWAADLTERDQRLLALYGEAVEHYFARDFAAAIDLFSKAAALERYPLQANPSLVLRQRCRHCLQNPPPDHWRGEWNLTSK